MNVRNPTVRRQLGGLAFAAAIVGAVGLLVTPEVLFRWVRGVADDPVVFGVVVVALFLLRPLAAWPVTPIAVVTGFGYGLALGLPVAAVGATVTALPPFAIARTAGGDGVLAAVGESGESLLTATGDFRGVLAARLVPVPTDVVSYAAGVSGVPTRPFVLGTFLGELPWIVVAVLVGSSMHSLSADGMELVDVRLVAAGLLAAVLVLAGPVYRHVGE